MARTVVRDSVFRFEATGAVSIPCTSEECENIIRAAASLNRVLPMSTYNLARVGTTDVWNVTAVAKDMRAYTTTVTIVDGVPKYTLTSLPQGTGVEVEAFLVLVQLLAKQLKICDISAVQIIWD